MNKFYHKVLNTTLDLTVNTTSKHMNFINKKTLKLGRQVLALSGILKTWQ